MIIHLSGLLDDGAPLAAGVAANPRRAVSVVRGQDVTIAVTVTTPQGEPVDVSSPAALVLTVKKRPQDYQAVATKAATVAAGVASFALTPADFKNESPGLFVYDVWLTKSGARNPVVPLSPLHLEAAATAVP